MDVGKLHRQGWHHKIELEEGIRTVYEPFRDSVFA
jgi:nucleoside-diphosphate-sugar epimerase